MHDIIDIITLISLRLGFRRNFLSVFLRTDRKCLRNPNLNEIIITPEGTSKLLKNLNPTKAIGPDKISPHFLKEVHDEISSMISDLFQSPVNTDTVPTDWGEAIVTPVVTRI
jgi:hypothetical protein